VGQTGGTAGLLEQSLDELEGDPDAGQTRVRIAGIRQDRIEHGRRRGQRVAGTMMVGDDDVDALFPGPSGELDGLDAAVHADDQGRAALDRDADVIVLDAVAVGQALRDEVVDLGAQRGQGFLQHDRRKDAVDIVIAEDEDLLAPGDRRLDPGHGLVHVLHQVGIVELVEAAREFLFGGLLRQDLAVDEDPGDGRRDVQSLGQRVGFGARRMDDPDGGVHGALTLA
jgi:hypothetical protein